MPDTLFRLVLALAVLASLQGRAMAEVSDRTPNGFTIKVVVDIAAPPETVYVSLVRHVDGWWNKDPRMPQGPERRNSRRRGSSSAPNMCSRATAARLRLGSGSPREKRPLQPGLTGVGRLTG